MKTIIRIFVFLLVFATLLTGCGAKTVKVDETMNGKLITAEIGDKVTISLAGNPTTGFNWELLAYNDQVLSLVGEPVFKPDSKAIGAGGVITFTFKAVTTGETGVNLVYHRSWETDVPPEKEFAVLIKVE